MRRMKKIIALFPFPVLLLSLLFAVKVLYLAFCVTPLWGVPDEIGHYAYVQDIATGKGIPILGKAEIGADIMGTLEKIPNPRPAYNWIAQHPPAYYIIAAIPLKIGSYFTNDSDILFRLPRIVSALSGTLLILVLFRTFSVVGLDPGRATALAAAVGFIPMVTHLSSGTTTDITLFLFCALATHFFVRYLMCRNINDAYWCAMWLAIAGGVKMMTPWVLTAAMVAILLLELRGPVKSWLKHAVGISLLAFSTPIIWMFRNAVYFGTPLYTAGNGRKPDLTVPLAQNFVKFLHLHINEMFGYFISTFYGRFGDMSPSYGKTLLERDITPRIMQVSMYYSDNFSLNIFLILIFCIACICLTYLSVIAYDTLKNEHKPQYKNCIISWVTEHIASNKIKKLLLICTFLIALLVAIFVVACSKAAPQPHNILRISAVSISIFLGIAALILVLYTQNSIERIALYGLVIFFFFGSLLFYHDYASYMKGWGLSGLQGRYLYPVIPLALVTLAISLMRLRINSMFVNIIVAILALAELDIFTLKVLPFYLQRWL